MDGGTWLGLLNQHADIPMLHHPPHTGMGVGVHDARRGNVSITRHIVNAIRTASRTST